MNPNSAVRNEPHSNGARDASGPIRSMGWLGVTVGLTELAFPRALAGIIGVDQRGPAPAILRAMGVRELASSLPVLARPDHPAPRWARVLGDAIDLGLLGLALTSRRAGKRRIAIALGMIAGVTALDVIAARRTARTRRRVSPVIASVTINKSPRDVYEFFRRFDQLPRFMEHLASVEQHGRRSTWTARLPIGGTISWDADIIEDRPGEALAWRSVEGSAVETRGRVTFTRAPGRDMTELRIDLRLGALGSSPSSHLAKLFARPQVRGDLQRLKQVIETGEVLHSDTSVHHGRHPAQPSAAGTRTSEGATAHAAGAGASAHANLGGVAGTTSVGAASAAGAPGTASTAGAGAKPGAPKPPTGGKGVMP